MVCVVSAAVKGYDNIILQSNLKRAKKRKVKGYDSKIFKLYKSVRNSPNY